MGSKRRRVRLLCFRQLLVERLRRVEFKGLGRLTHSDRGRFLAHLFTFQITFQRIQEQAIMRNAVPIEYLLLLLRPNTVILVQEIEESTLGLFQRRICAGFEIAQVGENTLFELLRVLYGAAECLESKGQASHNIRTGDVKEVAPAKIKSISSVLLDYLVLCGPFAVY